MGSNPIFSAIRRGIAQLVEQRSPKPRAVGSIPTAPAIYSIKYRGVAQFGSATGLGPVGRGFKSCHPDHLIRTAAYTASVNAAAQKISFICGPLAQRSEHPAHNRQVQGSSP